MDKSEKVGEKTILLKEARLQLLRLHKLLIDIERKHFEKSNGQISSGQFLNLLVNDQNFKWLRKFSILIVEIDEMLDLDDGFDEAMVDKHLSNMRELLNLNTGDEDFDEKYEYLLQINSEVTAKHGELKKLLSE